MLSKHSYAFIIGAGGSHPYGFPLGEELYANIRDSYAGRAESYLSENAFYPFNERAFTSNAKKFSQDLKLSRGISIDKYLNINKTYKDHGVTAIISDIFSAEKESLNKLHLSPPPKLDWYKYLFQKLTQGLNKIEDLPKFGHNKVGFITFNYDRSLEYFLFENLYGMVKNAGISRKEVVDIFKQIPIYHVYGSLGHLSWQKEIYDSDQPVYRPEEGILDYGIKHLNGIAVGLDNRKMVEIMYEERKEKSELEDARNLIKNSTRILFLGFGFDETNLSILDIPSSISNKQVFATSMGSTKNEIVHLENLLDFEKLSDKSKIYDFDCLMLLREHLI